MTQTPQGNNPVKPQTPTTNQQVPQAPGNPRFKTGPGLDPSPNPRIVVKAVNPPVTPDQVVAMAAVSYTHLRAHETRGNLVCRLLLEKKKKP